MSISKKHQCDVVVIGAGLSGLTTALELIHKGKKVILIERNHTNKLGGLATQSGGGINIIGSPVQKRTGILDSPDLAYRDWCNFAEFDETDYYPKAWAKKYTEESVEKIYYWLKVKKLGFFPLVHWVERGLYKPGNSVPRFHIIWGMGSRMTQQILSVIEHHSKRNNLTILPAHNVTDLITSNNKILGCEGFHELQASKFQVLAENVVVASGGIVGDLAQLRKYWYPAWGEPPKVMLNGSHPYADGRMHQVVAKLGGNLTNMTAQWNYAAGVHHPEPQMANHGLSLVPPRSALWVNYQGKRIGPSPLVSSFDTRHLVKSICQQDKKYSWQIMNWRIAVKELSVSGCDYNAAFKDRSIYELVKTAIFGNYKVVKDLTENCIDFVVADTLPELVNKMNALNGDTCVDLAILDKEISTYDQMIDRGERFQNDEQLRRIAQVRNYSGDRAKTCHLQKIIDSKSMPLIAIREFIISRKSLGGLQTNLKSQVMDQQGNVIPNLYAVGEAAGFGGGGIHGKRSLEGTFLGACILTGQAAAQAIVTGG